MSFNIVAVLTDPATTGLCLDAAACAATVSPDARIEAFHPRPSPESFILPSEEVMTERRHAKLTAMLEARSEAIQHAVRDWIAVGSSGRSAAWSEQEGHGIKAIVAARGKVADLIVLVRPDAAEGEAALHAAIFDTGRPLLLVPPNGAPPFGRHMAIAWKPSNQAERAVKAAMPWLKHARHVSVLTVGKADGSPRDPDGAVALLEGEGVKPASTLLAREPGSVGEQLLREAYARGADCIVMGAYRHSQLREFILGGVTRHMLHTADLPLFMVH